MRLHITEKSIIMKVIILLLLSASWAVLIAFFITGHFWEIDNIHQNLASFRLWTGLNRAYILFFVLFFIGLHFIIPIKKMYKWIFRYRWLMAFLLLAFLTINRYHGDSISYYYNSIQPGIGDASSNPIFGEERKIRSDEFIGVTPSVLASGYGEDPYGKYNEIVRGTKTLNIINGVYLGYCTLAYAPWQFVYMFLPVEYAFSFCWYAPLILSFLFTLELFYIITKKRELLSTAGAFLVVFSSFYLWWTFSTRIMATAGTIVFLHYFFNSNGKKRFFFGLGTALCFAHFIITLYPAWQVPFGYMYLAIGVWLLHENWQKIKEMTRKEWLLLGISLIFCMSLIVSYFYTTAEYTEAISNTVYPGDRKDFGGNGLAKIFFYAQAPFYAFKDIGNPSEVGVFFSLFPIPSLMALYCWINEKKKDWLTAGLLIVQLPMLIYVTFGLPEKIAVLTLFSRSTTYRVVDVIGLIQIYFIVILFSRYKNAKKMSLVIGVLGGGATAVLAIWISNSNYPNYLNSFEKIIMFVVISSLGCGLIVGTRKKIKELIIYSFISISIITSFYIRPLMKGLDAIYSKPVANVIRNICDEDKNAKWATLGLGITLPAYNVACGAPTINSLNVYPNMELWEKLDPEGEYEKIYNRFAHVTIEFTEKGTSFEEIQGDSIQVNLSYKDIKKTEISYLLVGGKFEANLDNGYVEFQKLYSESGMSVYKLNYLD